MDKPMLVKTEEAILYTPQFDLPVTGEGTGEYTMPDYYPEIRRVVSVSAKALPDSKFLSGNLLEFGGTLAFSVLYIGEDGALVCVPYACEYSGNCQLPGEVQGGSGAIYVDTVAEAPQCRVLAPRRISLRTRLRSRITADETHIYSCRAVDTDGERATPADLQSLEKLPGTLHTLRRARATSTGTAEGELRERAGTKPVSCDGSVLVADVLAGNDVITVKGDICIHCIAFGPDGLYTVLRGRLPFEETIPADGAREGDAVTAWGRAASVSVSSAEDDSGVSHAQAEYDLEALWCRKSEVAVTNDIYSTEYSLEAKRTELNVLGPLCCGGGALTLSGSTQRKGKAGSGDYLIDVSAIPTVEKAEYKDHKVIFVGNCAVRALIASEGDVVCEEFSIPLKYETRAESEADTPADTVWQAFCTVTDATGRLEGDHIAATVELCVCVHGASKTASSPVTEAVLDKYNPRGGDGAVLRVCFPEPGQRVWEIAKRCGACGAEVERINKIQRDAVCDGTPLIIK